MGWARRLLGRLLGKRAKGDLACDPECLRLCVGDLVSRCASGPRGRGWDCATYVMDSLDICLEECCG